MFDYKQTDGAAGVRLAVSWSHVSRGGRGIAQHALFVYQNVDGFFGVSRGNMSELVSVEKPKLLLCDDI